jgi:hypothetical protein
LSNRNAGEGWHRPQPLAIGAAAQELARRAQRIR